MSVDGLFHVVRIFEDAEVTHVEGAIDPVRDLQIISDELRFKDIERCAGLVDEKEGKIRRSGGKTPKEDRVELELLQKVLNQLKNDQKPVRCGDWTNSEVEVLNRHLFLTAKPVVYLVNMSEEEYIKKKSKWLAKIKAWVDEADGGVIIPFSAGLEAKLVELDQSSGPPAVEEYLKEKGTTSGLTKIIKSGFSTLNLIYFFTAGTDEVKCWTIRQGTLAPQAAGTIHTDFEKGFICAEIMTFEDFKEFKSETAVKAAGKYKQKGREYVVLDGDIIFFKFNAPSQGGKKK